MLHIKFQTYEHSGSAKEEFLIFLYVFPSAGHLGPRDLCLNKLGKAPVGTCMQCYIPNFKHVSKVVLKKIFEYFSMYFYSSNLRPLWQDHLAILI